MFDVQLKDITENTDGSFELIGPYAHLIEGSNDTYDYSNVNSDFNFTRDNLMFEAVMTYYYTDQLMRYANEELGYDIKPTLYDGGLQFIPHATFTQPTARYSPNFQTTIYGSDAGVVESNEDGDIILHETGHALHYLSTDDIGSRAEGLVEGIADYFAMSYTRDYTKFPYQTENTDDYNTVVSWGLLPYFTPFNRTVNYTADYCSRIGGHPNNHESGQWFSTAMMKIYSAIGKEKADILLLETLPLIIFDNHQFTVARFLYETAQELNYSSDELCAIYNELNSVYCIELSSRIDPPEGNTIDLYMKDTPIDLGVEPNQDEGHMWTSRDIWVRRSNDGKFEHQNPEYHPTEPNFIYVRVRSKGCNFTNDADLHVYYSKASTGLRWPTSWVDSYILNNDGVLVLVGDEATPPGGISIMPISAGEEQIISIPWFPPNPGDFNDDKHHFCLLAKIVSSDDLLNMQETVSTVNNVRANNNLVLRNVSVYDYDDNDDNIVGPINIHLDCSKSSSIDHQIVLEGLQMGDTNEKFGQVYISSNNTYIQNTLEDKYSVSQIDPTAPSVPASKDKMYAVELEDIIDFEPDSILCSDFLSVYYEPYTVGKRFEFNIIEREVNTNVSIGGEHFVYSLPIKTDKSLNKLASQTQEKDYHSVINEFDAFHIYPNPISNRFNIGWNDNADFENSTLNIFSINGRLVSQYQNVQNGQTLEVDQLHPGFYIVELTSKTKGNVQRHVKSIYIR